MLRYLADDRDQFLVLSLGKFNLPETINITRENLTELSKTEEHHINKRPFGSTFREAIAVSSTHALATEQEDEELAKATETLLAAIKNNQTRKTMPTPLDPSTAAGRILHLTNCLWRYLPLRKMTSYHLWSILTRLKEINVVLQSIDNENENDNAEAIDVAQLREIFPDMVRALGSISQDTQYDGTDLEHVSAVLQVLAALPEYEHGKTAPRATAEVSLEALAAFSRIPHVVESTTDITSRASELAAKLEHGNADTVAFGSQTTGTNGDSEEAAYQRARTLEQDGAAAAAILLRRHCRDMVGTKTKLSGIHEEDEENEEDGFSDSELGKKASELLNVVSKMTHDPNLIASTAPVVFEAIQRSLNHGTVLQMKDVSSVCVILSSLDKESDAYVLGAELLRTGLSKEGCANAIREMVAGIAQFDSSACIALSALINSGSVNVDDVVNVEGALQTILNVLDNPNEMNWTDNEEEPKALIDIAFALASTNRGLQLLKSSPNGVQTLLDHVRKTTNEDTSNTSDTSDTKINSKIKRAMKCAATLIHGGVVALKSGDKVNTIAALKGRPEHKQLAVQMLMNSIVDAEKEEENNGDHSGTSTFLLTLRQVRDEIELGRNGIVYNTVVSLLTDVMGVGFAENLVEKPPLNGFLSSLLDHSNILNDMSIITSHPKYISEIFEISDYDLDEIVTRMKYSLSTNDEKDGHGEGDDEGNGSKDGNSSESLPISNRFDVKKAARCADIISNILQNSNTPNLNKKYRKLALQSIDLGVVAELAVQGINLAPMDSPTVRSFLHLLETLPAKITLSRGGVHAARAAQRNPETSLSALHLINSFTKGIITNKISKTTGKRKKIKKDDLNLLMKSGCVQYTVGIVETLTERAKLNGGSTTGEERSMLILALETLSVMSSTGSEECIKRMTASNVSSLLVDCMRVHSRTDRSITSLAASTLARISSEDTTSLEALDHLSLSHVDARLVNDLLQDLDLMLKRKKGKRGNVGELLDILGSDLSQQTSGLTNRKNVPIVCDMLRNVMAQRMAEDLATEEGIASLVHEIESSQANQQRTEAAVKVLRRIVGQDRINKDGSKQNEAYRHLIDLKVGAKVARALAASQSDEFRQDALHFLQGLTSNREDGFSNQGLELSDLVLISNNIQQARDGEDEGENGQATHRHSMLLGAVKLALESHADRPPPSKELFDALYQAIDVLAEDDTASAQLKERIGSMDQRWDMERMGDAGAIGVVIRALIQDQNENNRDNVPDEHSQLLPWCRFLRECVHDVYWSRVVASEGGLIIAVQVIVKYMDAAMNGDVYSLDLIRVCVHLLADACVNCKENSHHVFRLHIVTVIHNLLIHFKSNPNITKATCCLAINLCHDDPAQQKQIGAGILRDLSASLDMFLPHDKLSNKSKDSTNSTNSIHSTDSTLETKSTKSKSTKKSDSLERYEDDDDDEEDIENEQIFDSPTDEVVCTWLLKFCGCVSFEDSCAVDMVFLGITKYAIRGIKIACMNGNNDLFSVCSNLIGNLVITAHDDTNSATLKEQLIRQIWRDGTVECIMFVLRNAQDPSQLMYICEVIQAFLDDDASATKMILARNELNTSGDAAGLEMIGTLLDRLVEFQWDLEFCAMGVLTIARFAELEDPSIGSKRNTTFITPADVLVRAGCVQVLIGELEDCAENRSATNVANECLNALDNIAVVSQDARRGLVGMGGIHAVASVIREHGKHVNDPRNVKVVNSGLSLLMRVCINQSLVPQIAKDCIGAVMDVARNHARNPKILKPLFHLLTMMAFEVETLEIITEENAISFVIDTLCNMYQHPAIVMQAITVLETIGTASPDHARVVANEGGKTAIKGKSLEWFFCGEEICIDHFYSV